MLKKRAEDAERHGLKPTTVQVYGSVMDAVKPFNRLKGLGIRHYMLVMNMQSKDQKKWLNLAIKENWSVAQMRAANPIFIGRIVGGLNVQRLNPIYVDRIVGG